MTVQTSFNPRNGLVVPAPAPDPPEAVDAVVATAAAAAEPMAAVPPATRAGWLTAIAGAVEADAEPLAALADEETALGLPRLTGELAGAARALRFYGSVAAEGSYLQAAIDHAAPGRPDVRRVNVPLGPVAVFGASNFPFGFGVLGHDTASALAAGCPVVVKAHPAHPRLSARLAEIAGEAMAGAGVTTGPFGIVHGFDAGTRLVSHPAVRAVGFTGSLAGGLALWRLAASRPEVIPVYAEMGTVNTVVVTPSAAAERPAEIAAGFVSSFTLGMGQFCTKPGLLLAPAGSGLAEETARALAAAAPDGWLLTEAIAGAYHSGLDRLASAGGRVVAQLPAAPAGWAGTPTVLAVDAAALTSGTPLFSMIKAWSRWSLSTDQRRGTGQRARRAARQPRGGCARGGGGRPAARRARRDAVSALRAGRGERVANRRRARLGAAARGRGRRPARRGYRRSAPRRCPGGYARLRSRTCLPQRARGAARRQPVAGAAAGGRGGSMTTSGNLAYDVLVNDPPPQDGLLPNGEPKRFSPQASTLIYGSEEAVLTDPGLTAEQARAVGDWVEGKGRNLTDIFITHGHGDHWFAAGLLADRFGARVVASAGTIGQMRASAATRPVLWDKLYPGLIPPAPVTAVTVPGNRFTLEGHDLVIVETGDTDSADSTVLHVPDLGLVVAGDVIYNGVHMYLAQRAIVGGLGPWRAAIDTVEALQPRHIVCGHQNKELDDDAGRTIAETRQYLDDADDLLRTENTATGFFNAKIERYPDHLGRMILWIGASVVYGVRDHPEEDIRKIILSSWL